MAFSCWRRPIVVFFYDTHKMTKNTYILFGGTMKKLIAIGVAAVLAGIGAGAAAQNTKTFPSKEIRVIVPFTPGSGSDTSARYFGEQLGDMLGQPVIVENKPGAGGIVALTMVKALPADGHTIVLASNSPFSVNPVVMKDLPYDPYNDFKPLAGLSKGMNVLVIKNEPGVDTLAQFIEKARNAAQPVAIGTYSAGYELATAWLADIAGFEYNNIPYKGQAAIVTDVVGGRLDAAMLNLSAATEIINAGKLKAVAVSGAERHPAVKDIPTFKESGFKDYELYSWTSFYVHGDTPPEITKVLADAMTTLMSKPE
nr:tripartite tricarboxylate transporter substrate binding protein [Pseudomonas sp.]